MTGHTPALRPYVAEISQSGGIDAAFQTLNVRDQTSLPFELNKRLQAESPRIAQAAGESRRHSSYSITTVRAHIADAQRPQPDVWKRPFVQERYDADDVLKRTLLSWDVAPCTPHLLGRYFPAAIRFHRAALWSLFLRLRPGLMSLLCLVDRQARSIVSMLRTRDGALLSAV